MTDPRVGCRCHFCATGKTHRHSPGYDSWERGGQLLVADSLDPKDILPTKTCTICAHTEVRND